MALIILGHPDYDNSLANRTIVDELKKSDIDIEIRNLHRLYPDFKIDVKEEQNALLKHNTIVFQYPIYWYNMPSILKHWFDVVFEYQFAYGSKGDKLQGKNFVPSFTVGAPEDGYSTLKAHHFRVLEFCKNIEQTAYFAKMNYINPIYVHGTSLAAGYKPEDIIDTSKKHAVNLISRLRSLG